MVELRVHEANDSGALAAARSLVEAAERADGRPPVSDQAMLAAARGQRLLLSFEAAGAGAEGLDPQAGPAAVGIVGEGEVDLVVAPGARGRGIGAAALRELLSLARGDELRAWSHGENPAADALLERAGFAPVRSLFRMALDPSLLPGAAGSDGAGADPFAVPLPDGFRLRTFDAEHGDAETWVRLNAAAFASHPEQGRITLADFALMREEPWFDAADLFLVEDDAGPAGFTWVKTVRGEGSATVAELYAIGVDPARAGHGLGRALLGVTLARMAQHSPDRVDLYVDGENERAVGMYERAGFTVRSRSRQWLLPLGTARMDP